MPAAGECDMPEPVCEPGVCGIGSVGDPDMRECCNASNYARLGERRAESGPLCLTFYTR